MTKQKPRKSKVGKVAAKEPKPLPSNTSIRDAGEKMRALNAEKFPVVAGNKLVGTVKGKHPDRRVAGFGHDPTTILVAESMTKEKFYCSEDQTVEEARKIMRKNGLTHLPVVDGKFQIVGMVSLKKM